MRTKEFLIGIIMLPFALLGVLLLVLGILLKTIGLLLMGEKKAAENAINDIL